MLKRYTRALTATLVASDAVLAALAFLAAYSFRFDSGLIPAPKGQPPLQQYLNVLPLVAVLVPFGFYFQRLYRPRRGATRVDDFFAVLVGSVIAVVLGVVATLYIQTYVASGEAKARGAFEVSQAVWAIFLVFNVAVAVTSREVVRRTLQRRWRAGVGLRRLLIVGAGDLGRVIADKFLEHRELGFRIAGFLDDLAEDRPLGYRGLPMLGTLDEVAEVIQRERIDQVYIALPLEQHAKMLAVVDQASRECLDVKVVPDLLQFIALRATLEELDGVPVININDVPLQGINSVIKRTVDIVLSAGGLVVLALPGLAIAAAIKLTSPGPVFYRQERMGLDGKAFNVLKFRSMVVGAEEETGPVFAEEIDPRCTAVGALLRRFDFDELPQLWNIFRGDMSLVGPRPERPYFVGQFKHSFPQYMLRHKVRAGLTGWAQVNGWRGNTSIEKRIEFDLYYIENWSLRLDFKIIWMTLLRGVLKSANGGV